MAVSFTRLHPTLRLVAYNLPRVARQLGFSVKITSAYRSPQKQAKLYQAYLRGLTPYVVAKPGTSKHEKGLALDITTDNLTALVNLLQGVGLRWAGLKDPVHFEL